MYAYKVTERVFVSIYFQCRAIRKRRQRKTPSHAGVGIAKNLFAVATPACGPIFPLSNGIIAESPFKFKEEAKT